MLASRLERTENKQPPVVSNRGRDASRGDSLRQYVAIKLTPEKAAKPCNMMYVSPVVVTVLVQVSLLPLTYGRHA